MSQVYLIFIEFYENQADSGLITEKNPLSIKIILAYYNFSM